MRTPYDINVDDRIWALVAKNLANEASIAEFQELDEMLKQYPDTEWLATVINDWWREDIQEEIDRRGALLFERIKKTIKANEEQVNSAKNHRPK